MQCDFHQSEEFGTLACSGSITVQDVAVLRHHLFDALAIVNTLVLHFEGIEEVDVSFLQLLCSAHLTAGKLEKELTLGGISPAFLTAVEMAGYARHFSCPLGTTGNCFWIVGKAGE
jgi:anti-anti-sigma regulatory factor